MATRNLTEGSVAKGVVLYALPLLGTSLVQQLYSTVDLLFVGNVLGSAGTASLGVGSLLITLLVCLFVGASIGANVKIAHLFGAGDGCALGRAVNSMLVLAFASGAALVIVGAIAAKPFVEVMDVPAESAAGALSYVSFAVAAALPIGVYNICAGTLRGMGDSSSPLLVQGLGGLCNIAGNWLALCVLGWGIVGCAVATFVSNSIAAVLVVSSLVRIGASMGLPRPSLAVDGTFIGQVLALGAPVALQTFVIALSNVAVQHQVDLLGVSSIAAFTIYLKVELPVYYVILAMGQATTTFVAQNHGRGLLGRCERGTWICQWICLAGAIAMSCLMLAVGPWAFGLFDRNSEVISIGMSMIKITFPLYFLYAVLEVQGDALRGYGHSLVPAIIVLFNICLLRVALVWALTSAGHGIEAIAATYPITWTTTAACMCAARLLYRRRLRVR